MTVMNNVPFGEKVTVWPPVIAAVGAANRPRALGQRGNPPYRAQIVIPIVTSAVGSKRSRARTSRPSAPDA